MRPVHCCAWFLLYFMTDFTSAARLLTEWRKHLQWKRKRTNWLRVYLRVIDSFSASAVTNRGALVRVHIVDNGWTIPTGWSDLSPLTRCMTINGLERNFRSNTVYIGSLCRLYATCSQVTVCYFTKYWIRKSVDRVMFFSTDHIQFLISLPL